MKWVTRLLTAVIICLMVGIFGPALYSEARDARLLVTKNYTVAYVPAKVTGIMFVPEWRPGVNCSVPDGAVVVDSLGRDSCMSITVQTSMGESYTRLYFSYPKQTFAVGDSVFVAIRYRPDGSIMEYDILKESTSDN